MTDASACDPFPPSNDSNGTMAAAAATAVRPPALPMNERRLGLAGLLEAWFLTSSLLSTAIFLSLGSASCDLTTESWLDILSFSLSWSPHKLVGLLLAS